MHMSVASKRNSVTKLKLSDKNVKVGTFSEKITSEKILDLGQLNALVIRITNDRKYWIVGLDNGSVILFATDDGSNVSNYLTLHPENENLPCVDLQCVPNNNEENKTHLIVAAYVSGHVRLWHYTSATPEARLLASIKEERIIKPVEISRTISTESTSTLNQILTCSCSFDGKRFITGGDDSHLRIYDIKTRSVVRYCYSSFSQDKMDGHVMKICAVKYHPRGALFPDYVHIFITGGWDDTIQIWDDRYLHSLWIYHGPHISGSDALEIEPESNHILSSSWRREKAILQVWKFNEDLMAHFYLNAQHSKEDELSIPSGTELLNSQTTAVQYTKPVAEIAQDGFDTPSKGYVARWLGPYFIAFGGSNAHVLRIISRLTLSVVATVTDLPNGIYSLDYIPPDPQDYRRIVQLGFVAGTKIYLARLEQK